MKNKSTAFAIYFFLLPVIAIVLFIAKFINNETEYKPERIVNVDKQYVLDTTLLEDVRISIYHPTVGQTDKSPTITADGSVIDSEKPQRWIAVSKDLLRIFPFGSKLNVKCDIAPIVNGEYEVHDTGCAEGVDILVANPIVFDLKGCWKGDIYKVDTIN
jgi:3D (Asp-Asp-Asp) domain-containing protein